MIMCSILKLNLTYSSDSRNGLFIFSLLFVLLFAEIKITQRKFSPTIVLITLWIGVLIVTQIYSSALWQLSVETIWWVFGGVFAFL